MGPKLGMRAEFLLQVHISSLLKFFNMYSTKWLSDPAHSEVQFKVRHLMITTVTGYFRKFKVEVETTGDDFTKASRILFTAGINSIDTNNSQRDTHLKSADFFDSGNHPDVKFEGKNFTDRGGQEYLLNGDLTIRGVTKPVTLEVEYGGIVTDPYGQVKAGFTIDGKIRRKDFGLMWDAVTEAGQVVVSNDIKIHAEIQLIKQEEKAEREVITVEEVSTG
jgi:polyisoprenoid-binding protein YceI